MPLFTKSERREDPSSGAPGTTASIREEATSPQKNSRGAIGSTVCPNCGQSKLKESKTCHPCFHLLRNKSGFVQLSCDFCKKEFTRPGYMAARAKRRGCADAYCSKECSQQHHAVKNAGRCPQCGQPKLRGDVYCSEDCKSARKGERQSLRTKKRERPCGYCGDIFDPVNGTRIQYCGKECADKAHSERMTGHGNSHTKEGTSPARHMRELRPLIMERDHASCMACKATEVLTPVVWRGFDLERSNLHIHHIDQDPTHNVPENLIMLCSHCHLKHHKSKKTPFPWLEDYALAASRSMTCKWKERITSLQVRFK